MSPRGDDGAVTILVAMLTIVVVGLAAFSTDFGIAYNSKRNLQRGADAGALAAANSLARIPGTCSTVVARADAVAAAQQVADEYASVNREGQSRVGTLDVHCSGVADGLPQGAAVVVGYTSTGTTPRIFGAIFGGGDLSATRTSAAAVETPPSAGIRPYAVCSTDLAGFDPASPSLVQVTYPKSNDACGNQSGNWYTLNCPESVGNNSTNVLAEKTRDGCSGDVSVVADQPSATPDDAALKSTLMAACAGPADGDCLESDPGNFSGAVMSAWKSLLGQVIVMPVFHPGTVTQAGGNAHYPVKSLVAARVCGYHFGANANQDQYGAATVPQCSGVAVPAGSSGENYLVIKPVTVVISGSLSAATCVLGDTDCDTNTLRRVRLVK